MNVCPAIVSVPLRAPPPLAAALNVTIPPPLPLAADVTVIQNTWLVAVHAQPADVETVIAPAPPATPMA